MRRTATAMPVFLAALAIPLSAPAQQPLGPDQTVPPPGHPPMDAPGGGDLPSGHPPVAPAASASGNMPAGHPQMNASPQPTSVDEGLPPGHPSVAASSGTRESAGPTQNPHGSRSTPDSSAPPNDSVTLAKDLPEGTVEVTVRNERSLPLPNTRVELAVELHDVAEGDSTEKRSANTDENGVVRFANLPIGTSYTFRAAVNRSGGRYVSSEFRLGEGEAQRVVLHAYPTTSDIQAALVGLRGIIFVQPREDVFRVDLTYQVFNIGRVAWVPAGQRIELPSGAEGIRVSEAVSEGRVERGDDTFVTMRGTFPPGQLEVGYGFQLDNTQSDTRAFRVPLPPHVAELRVIVEGGRTVDLDVEGFPEAQRVRGQGGMPLLVSGRQLSRGQTPLSSVSFTISGLPVPSRGRWYAVLLAGAIAAAGVWTAGSKRGSTSKARVSPDDAARARTVLLDELALLETMRSREEVGPRTYEATRRTLLDALARLEVRQISSPGSAGDAAQH